MDPYQYIVLSQYDVLAGIYECDVSGTITTTGNELDFIPYQNLYCNKEYHIIVKVGFEGSTTGGLLEQYESIFITFLTPLYSSPILVRLAGGSMLDGISNDSINRLILEHSIIMQNLWPTPIDECNIPWFITRYITCKVAYELLSGAMQAYIGGAISKRLGDFQIDGVRDVNGIIRPKLSELESCIANTMAFILNQGKLHAGPRWSARSKQFIERNSNLIRIPMTDPSHISVSTMTSERYGSKGKKELWF